MIHYVTVHWKCADWITIQLEHIRKWTSEPYKVHAYLTDISEEHYDGFDIIKDKSDPTHAEKLNELAADILASGAKDSDPILFIDGDAYPIAAIDSWLFDKIDKHDLVAVQRLENNGDLQPHPCFCSTTVGFWRKISGDWREGFESERMGSEDCSSWWKCTNSSWETDVGGRLLKILCESNVDWYKMHKSNTLILDDLMFGVYSDLIYHHGMGFRPEKGGRIALIKAGNDKIRRRIDAKVLDKLTPGPFMRNVRRSMLHPIGRMRKRIFNEKRALSEEIFERIKKDPSFVYKFIE